ncbi:ladderlectin-like isoform X2 [Chanodichthys erythropterus]|uniref:ladderlectin-like isoform X2 n=1 Tax=Chanodichthys erythropterus TaxID=933992 RepID=UPI00351E03C4
MAVLRSFLLLFMIFSMGNAGVDLFLKCPTGWTIFGLRCYKHFSQPANRITAEDGQWLWSDGTAYDYTKWCSGEPNNHHRPENCLEINNSHNRCWNDVPCSYSKNYVCVMDL